MEVFDITNPRFNEQISPVPWHFVKSRFHCMMMAQFVFLSVSRAMFQETLKTMDDKNGVVVKTNRQQFSTV